MATLGARVIESRHLTYHDVILEPDQPCAYSAENGLPLSGTFLTRGPTRHTHRFPFSPQLATDSAWSHEFEHVLYITFLNNHFGHLLTESLGHCWHAFDPPAELTSPTASHKPTVIIQNCKGPAEGPLLEQLSQRYEVLLGQQLSGRSRIQHLHAASPTLIFGYGISPRHLDEVRSYVQRILGNQLVEQLSNQAGDELIYLSRQNLDSALRHLIQEDVLVEELRSRGWQIVHPQELPLTEQMATYARARVIAGNLASAFHLLMAFGTRSPTLLDKHVLALVGEQIPRMYPMQFEAQGIRTDYLSCLKTVPYPPEQTTNLTLLDQEFTTSPGMIAEMIHARAQLM